MAFQVNFVAKGVSQTETDRVELLTAAVHVVYHGSMKVVDRRPERFVDDDSTNDIGFASWSEGPGQTPEVRGAKEEGVVRRHIRNAITL